jgi:hypothetical protein
LETLAAFRDSYFRDHVGGQLIMSLMIHVSSN